MGTTTTTNLGLVKPDGDEFVDIEVINRNMDAIDTAVRDVIKLSHPVGSIYMSVNPRNPNEAGGDFEGYGMTWASFGAGRVPVGVDSTHGVEGTGGNSTVSLSTDNLPAHTHNVSGNTGTESQGHTHNFNWSDSHSHSTGFVGTRQCNMGAGASMIGRYSSQTDSGTAFSIGSDSQTISINKNTGEESANHTHGFNVNSSSVGSGTASNIEQPWIGGLYVEKGGIMRQGETTTDCFIIPEECKEPTSASILFLKDKEIVGTVTPEIERRRLKYTLSPEYTQGLPTGSLEIQVTIVNPDGTFIFPNIPIVNYPTVVEND